MTNEQRQYAKAKARLETLREAIKGIMPARGTMTAEDYADEIERIYTEAGYYKALRVYHDAETALLDWAHSRVAELPQYRNHKADIDRVFASHLPSIRQKAVDLCMRLAA